MLRHASLHQHLFLALCLAVFGMLAGCSGGGDAPKPGATVTNDIGEPCEGDWIVFRLGAEPPHLNPYLEDAGAYSVIVVDGNCGHIFQVLTRRKRVL